LKILVFFTYGVSLRTWDKAGLLEREVVLYKKLKDRYNVEVTFLTYGDENDYSYMNTTNGINIVPIYSILKKPKNKFLSLVKSFFIPFLLKNLFQQHDLLKTNQMFGSWVAIIAGKIYSKPLLLRTGYELYSFSIQAKKSLFFRWFVYILSFIAYKSSNKIHVSSAMDKRFILEKFRTRNSAVEVIPNWIDCYKFNNIKPHSKRKNRLLFVGRLNKQKNIPFLLKAILNTKIGLDIVGSGEMLEELRSFVISNNIDVNFLGSKSNSEMPEIYNNYRIFVLPSDYEGNPKALLEAMSCGCTVVGRFVPGIEELVSNNINGILVEDSSKALREKIFEVINNFEHTGTLGNEASKTIIQTNSLQKILSCEFSAYERLVKN